MGTVTAFPGVVLDDGCRFVCVPGQKAWHTHVCPNCGSSWTHIAPTPMTQRMNEKIHTCTKCGTLVWSFVRLEELKPEIPYGWVVGGLLAGFAVATLLDRG
jgi:predicted RNA-binding Zn-ribbon protein involved in translation (DUF1610 family)